MNNFNPLVQEIATTLLGLLIILIALFFGTGYIIRTKAPQKNKTMLDALITAINPIVFSFIAAAVAAIILHLLTLIISVMSFSWEFVGAIFLISLIFWIYIAIEHGD